MPSTREAISKGSYYFFDPDDLTVITDPEDPLFDPRALEPADQALTQSMFRFGFKTSSSVEVERRGDALVVIDGRRRVAAAKACKKLQREKGEDVSIRVRCMINKDGNGFNGMVLGNSHRKNESLLQLAQKNKRAKDMGQSAEERMALFGVSRQTLSNWEQVLLLPAPIMQTLERGDITMTLALELAKKPEAEQVKVLAGAKEAPIRGTNGKARVASPPSDPVSNGLTKKQIRQLVKHLQEPEDGKVDRNAELAAGVLLFVLGDDLHGRRLTGFDSVKAAAKLVRG